MYLRKNLGPLFLYLAIAGAAILLGCAGMKPFNFGSAETGYILSYRTNKGDLFRYVRNRDGVNSSERDGQSFEYTTLSNYTFQLETEKTDSLLHFIISVDSMSSYFETTRGRQDMDYGDIKGKRAHLTITPEGKQREITAIDSIPTGRITGMRGGQGFSRNPASQLTPGFYMLPDRPLIIGDSWTETKLDTITNVDTTRNISTTTIVGQEITYTILGEEMKMDLPCLHFKQISNYSREMEGSFRQMESHSEGEGETITEVWFAYEQGILVELIITDFYEGTTAYSGQFSDTMPNTTESKTNLRLIEWKPKKK
jgi:hypothetical protein